MKVVLGVSTALYRLGLGKLPCVNSMRCPKGSRSMGSNDNPATSLRSRRLEVVAKERTGAREGDTRGLPLPSRVSFSRARFFLCPLVQAPATQATLQPL